MSKRTVSKEVYDIDGKPPFREAFPLAIQHVLAMFAGNVTVPIIVAGAIGAADERAFLIQCAMLVAGLATLLQVYRIGKMGAKLPIVMGTSFGFVPTSIAIGNAFGLSGLLGATLIGGIFEAFLGFFIKPLRKFFPPIVTGIVLLTIGLSLLPTGITYVAGGNGAEDFGGLNHLFLAAVVLITIVLLNQFAKGMAKMSAILIGIIVGYIVAIPMNMIDFSGVAQASWFGFPTPLKYGLTFHWEAISAMIVLYIVTAVETVGDISGITIGGADREATDEELSGGVIADGVASAVGSLFNALPNTSFSQNVGIVSFTKVMSTHVVKIGGIFLALSALVPKLGALIAAMPSSVLGGAAIVMFGSIAVMGIKLISSEPLGNREVLILSIALCLGFGFGTVDGALSAFPESVQNVFGGSGIVIGFLVATLLNAILPKEKEEKTHQKKYKKTAEHTA
ncbi:NCS2 family nucleobase:cation symporter-2 [Natranaerovirga hydrolytica]|uniref:NCS2 family nucleobase:cation symporter-2 n=1 Tax=Natranaerovirga hydrolytica TaxID=680378 RepID=A0A4V2Q1J1_9FIRM|nr:nucleobase:cation symporter-2 family protein [Natranaerovirga hydrolytica]TCK97761.1 NCS2 family nucleobase:cation symporter-2 [Natranaerovirga hydrolytica]